MTSGKAPQRPATSGDGLEREKCNGELEFMKSESKIEGEGDLWPRRSLVKLLDEILTVIKSSERQIGAAGLWVSAATAKGKKGLGRRGL